LDVLALTEIVGWALVALAVILAGLFILFGPDV
jgi:hypothetical protein